uniref:Uncharacterized protein n=1 Tax=Romanomermis culicivorax TaxID=13658 RepID=A0A915KSZ8_ROMCU
MFSHFYKQGFSDHPKPGIDGATISKPIFWFRNRGQKQRKKQKRRNSRISNGSIFDVLESPSAAPNFPKIAGGKVGGGEKNRGFKI